MRGHMRYILSANCYLYIYRYGDKYAVTPAARILTAIWMLTGLIIQGMFVATVTMSLVSQSLDVDFKLYGSEVIPFHHFSRVRKDLSELPQIVGWFLVSI